jgi:hypothetical protein
MAQTISKPNLFPIIPHTCPLPSSFYTHLPAYEDGTECSETSAYKIQTPRNDPKESVQLSEHGEGLKSRITVCGAKFLFNCAKEN